MPNHEHEKLIAALLDGELSPSDQARLNELMKHDSSLRQLYLDHCQMVANLKWEEGSLNSEFKPKANTPKPQSNKLLSIFQAAAAILIISSAGFFYFNQETKPPRGEPVVTLTGFSGVEFAYGIDGKAITLDQKLPSGPYHLLSGLIELVYSNQTKLIIEAPAKFELKSHEEIFLIRGSITVHTPTHAKQFTLTTPHAQIKDIGVEYGLTINEDSTGEVHVFKGKVALHTKSTTELPYELVAGKASIVNSEDISPSSIDIDNERYIRRLEEPSYTYSELILKNKPVLYFPMQPSIDGITLMDQSGRQGHGEIHGVRGKPLWTVGRIGTCIRFEGPTKRGFVIVHDYPKTTNNTLSGAAWVYAKSRPKWASIMKNWGPGPLHGQFHFGLLEYEGSLEIHIEDANGEEVFAIDSKPLPLNEWHHVAFVANGLELKLYRNGEEVASTPYTSILQNPDLKPLAIGTKLNREQTSNEKNLHNDWHGRLDELSLFNHALEPKTIHQLYLAGLATLELN